MGNQLRVLQLVICTLHITRNDWEEKEHFPFPHFCNVAVKLFVVVSIDGRRIVECIFIYILCVSTAARESWTWRKSVSVAEECH